MKMQQDFIEELENRGQANIDSNQAKIDKLLDEGKVDDYIVILCLEKMI